MIKLLNVTNVWWGLSIPSHFCLLDAKSAQSKNWSITSWTVRQPRVSSCNFLGSEFEKKMSMQKQIAIFQVLKVLTIACSCHNNIFFGCSNSARHVGVYQSVYQWHENRQCEGFQNHLVLNSTVSNEAMQPWNKQCWSSVSFDIYQNVYQLWRDVILIMCRCKSIVFYLPSRHL